MIARVRHLFRELMLHEHAQISETNRIYALFLFSVGVMVCTFGAAYYLLQRYLGNPRTLVECLYFVWITLSTIGYSNEGFTGSAMIRWATMLGGSYLIVRFIVLAAHVYARTVVDEVYNLGVMREMSRCLRKAESHFLVFGDDREMIRRIIAGLLDGQEVYLVSDDTELIEDMRRDFPMLKYYRAKPSRAGTVDELRPETAAGAYLLYLDDARNILLAAMLRDRVRVISTFSGTPASLPRFKQVGVTPISPQSMGGLKMVSIMVRPQATDFLDRYVFPGAAPLEFGIQHNGDSAPSSRCIPLGTVVDDTIQFNAPIAKDCPVLVLRFKPDTAPKRVLGPIGGPCLQSQTDRFLVIGEGIISETVTHELALTRRRIALQVSPAAGEALRARYDQCDIQVLSPELTRPILDRDEFDGVAVCTGEDDWNFAAVLDFVDSRALRVVRAMDDDMEPHYNRIGVTPVFVGRVGAGNMLREVTNRVVNDVLRIMVSQSYRLDQAVVRQTCTQGEMEAQFGVRVLAYCREGTCFFTYQAEEELRHGDTVIVCGHVDANRRLRVGH